MNLIKHQRPDISKIYLYVKDPLESQHQLLINRREKVGIEILKNQKAFINYSKTTDDVLVNLEDYNPTKKRRVLIVFDDMIANIESNKKLNPIVTELFLGGRDLNFSLDFISQSYFEVPKTMRLNATHYFIMKTPSKKGLQQIASNNSSDIDFKDFMKLYKKCTKSHIHLQ